MYAVRMAMANALIEHEAECPARSNYQRMEAMQTANAAAIINFHTFQVNITGKVRFIHGVAWAWSVVLVILLGIFSWTFGQVYPALRIIMASYYLHHPEARIEHDGSSFVAPEVYSAHRNIDTSVAEE